MNQPGLAKRHVFEAFSPVNEAPFSKDEYASRLTRIRRAMAERDIDCLYLSAPESINYVSGYAAEWYQASSPDEWLPASGIAVHVDSDSFVHFEHEQEKTLIDLTAISDDVRLTSLEGYPQQEFIVQELAAMGWLRGTVGLEMGSYRPYRLGSDSFQRMLEHAGAEVIDGTAVTRAVRRIKSPAEREATRRAQRIADIGMAAARDTIQAGVTELEVYGAIVHAMSRAGGEVGAIPFPVLSGPRSMTLHGLAGRRVVKDGEIVSVDLSGVFNRYHANMARSFAVGHCDDEVAEAAAKIYGAVGVVSETIRPGLPVRDLLAALEEYYAAAGILGDEWWVGGYELGIAFPPDWVGGFVYSLGEDPGEEAFLPGDVVNFEANFYLPNQAGIAFCINSMVFDDDKAEFMQTTPSTLEILS